MIIRLPFSGFYQSHLNEELRILSEDEIEENINWIETHYQCAKAYTELFLEHYDLEGEFVEMISPKAYNFETDAVYADITNSSLALIKARALEDRSDFIAWIIDNCTSRDGYMSYVSNNLTDWPDDWEPKHYLAALTFLDVDEELITQRLFEEGRVEIILRGDNS